MDAVPYGAYGPVVVVQGKAEQIRIGYYDDDDWGEGDDPNDETEDGSDGRFAIVYFSEPPCLFDNVYDLVRPEQLRPIDTETLLRRRRQIGEQLAYRVHSAPGWQRPSVIDKDDSYRLLLEYAYVNELLADRMWEARMREGDRGGRRVFISHSSTDKETAVSLSVDLSSVGQRPWLDEWEIKAGESIPLKISDGVEQADYVLVLMSKIAVESGWVAAEWTAKYWDEIGSRKVQVIPALLEDCAIPVLLKTKRYADLRHDYRYGLDQILSAIE